MYLVELVGEGVGDSCMVSGSCGLWVCGFVSYGCIDVDGGVVGLSYNVGGILIGVDICVVDDCVIFGVSVVVVDMLIKVSDGFGFSGDVCVLDVGGYLDVIYLWGYLLVVVCYIDLWYDICCSVGGIDGL